MKFTRIGNITIIPEVKEINHGEYAVYIAAYSKTGSEQVMVRNVSLKEDEKIFFNQETEQSINYQQDSENIYGWVNIGSFTEEDMEFSNGKMLYLTVQVQVENDSQKMETEITYEIELIQYWRHVMET